jgi:ABC-type sugar transport system ATPase subunit
VTVTDVASTTPEVVLALEGVTRAYGKNAVLKGASMTVRAGDFYVVTGPPSSGKSVLLRIVLGLETPGSGRVLVHGNDVTDAGPQRRNIGYVPQSFALFPNKSVRDNITYPMRLDKADKASIQEALDRVCDLLAIGDLLDKRPDQLSGGQKQRVAIARGLAKQTDFFVLDDPLVGLDFKLRERLIDDLKRTRSALGVTFLYSTSDTLESLLLASRVGVLSDGRVVEEGDLADVYDNPQAVDSMRSLGFPETNVIEGSARSGRCTSILGEFDISDSSVEGDVLIGLRPEHVSIGDSSSGLSAAADVLFTEDVGGSEIVYLRVGGSGITTVLGSDSPILATLGSGTTQVSVEPESLVVFHPQSLTRLAQGVRRG